MAMSLPSLSAHIDCASGICAKALLAACLDAATGGAEEDQIRLANQLSKAFEEGVANLTQDGLILTEENLRVGGTGRVISMQPSRAGASASAIGDLITTFREYAVGSTKFWQSYPPWVAATGRRALSEIVAAAERAQLRPREEEQRGDGPASVVDGDGDSHTHLYHLVATLQCLESMAVGAVSHSPLPGAMLITGGPMMRVLLSGLVVDPSVMTAGSIPAAASGMSAAVGVALLRVLSSGAGPSPARTPCGSMVLDRFGSGTNERDLRVSIVVGRSVQPADKGRSPAIYEATTAATPISRPSTGGSEPPLWNSDSVVHLECNMDDVTGECLAFVIEGLMDRGALDAWVVPIVMKKGRPAFTLHCLCRDDDDDDGAAADGLVEAIFRHSTTLGVRICRNVPRATLDRSLVTVMTPHRNTARGGRVTVKVSKFRSGEVVSRKAEFDHCREISMETGVPLKWVAEDAVNASSAKDDHVHEGGEVFDTVRA